MKKMLWVVFVSLVAAPALLAQNDLEKQITRAVANAQQEQPVSDAQASIILRKLDGVRELVAGMKDGYEPSLAMQAVVNLADAFFAYIPQEPGVPASAADFTPKAGVNMRAWALVIDLPVPVGWNKDKTFIVTQAIDEFLEAGAWQWNAGSKEVHELAVFSAVIKQDSPWPQTQEEPATAVDPVETQPVQSKPVYHEPVPPLSSHLKR